MHFHARFVDAQGVIFLNLEHERIFLWDVMDRKSAGNYLSIPAKSLLSPILTGAERRRSPPLLRITREPPGKSGAVRAGSGFGPEILKAEIYFETGARPSLEGRVLYF